MNEYASEIELGSEYKDSVTGFQGKATSLVFSIGGEQRVLLERLDNDGSGVKSEWFDVTRIEG